MLAEFKQSHNNKCIKLIIADDHAIIRFALRNLIETNNMDVAAEAKSDKELFDLLNTVKFDLLIINTSIARQVSISTFLQTILKKIKKPLPIIVINNANDTLTATSVLKAGASGYLTNSSEPAQFIEAINKVAMGRKYICPEMAEKLLFSPGKEEQELPPEKLLTRREYQILLMIVEGKSIDSIAGELCISRQTVGTHKTRLMKKLGIQSIVDIVRFALLHGLLSF